MEAEQLKEVLAEAIKPLVTELKDEVKKLSTDLSTLKAEEEKKKADEMAAAKKKEEEELAAKKEKPEEPEEDDVDEEELSEIMASMTAENLAGWQELVKKYGLKGAAKHKAEMGKAEEKKEMSELKSTVAELKEKLGEAAPKKSALVETKDKTAVEQMSDRELDIRFFGLLQAMNGYEDTSEMTLKDEGYI